MQFENIFEGITITLMGLGQFENGSGISAALFLAPLCKKLIITDISSAAQLAAPLKKLEKFDNIELHLDGHRDEDFINTDWVIRNPDVPASSPFLKTARENNIPVDNDVTLFLKLFGTKNVIGVTGTRGKTTTTYLIHAMLKQEFPNAQIGGNVGVSPLTFLNEINKDDPVVLELSSFMLHDLQQAPHIVLWTTLYEDHLNKYESAKHYLADKQNLLKKQTKDDIAILNNEDVVVRDQKRHVKGKLKIFSTKHKVQFAKFTDVSKLKGEHNVSNLAAAVLAAQEFGVSDENIVEAIKGFSGVPYRLEHVRNLNGVDWYNDSTATSPEATMVALNTFEKGKIILITGGNTKGSSLTELGKLMQDRAREIILMPGNANADLPNGRDVETLEQAVQTATQLAKPEDVVLFSPGLTWLPSINEFARGDKFVTLVKKLDIN